jgi:prepilin-type N-terminal cleavage/methylation domain-containing protein
MKFKKKGFTLMEVVVALAIASVAMVGMFAATMSYMKIWQSTADNTLKEKFDAETTLVRFISNEISSAIHSLPSPKASEKMTFRKLTGEQAIPGESAANVAFYWQSINALPFITSDHGGITECWLKFEGDQPNAGPATPAELRLYYRSLGPGDKPKGLKGEAGTGKFEEPLQYVVLLKKCRGINYGYTEDLSSSPKITFFNVPKFKDGANPDFPELIQILIDDSSLLVAT